MISFRVRVVNALCFSGPPATNTTMRVEQSTQVVDLQCSMISTILATRNMMTIGGGRMPQPQSNDLH